MVLALIPLRKILDLSPVNKKNKKKKTFLKIMINQK